MLYSRDTTSSLTEMFVTVKKFLSKWKGLVSVPTTVSINISTRPPKVIINAYKKLSEDCGLMATIPGTNQIPGGNFTFRSPEMGTTEMTQWTRMFATQA